MIQELLKYSPVLTGFYKLFQAVSPVISWALVCLSGMGILLIWRDVYKHNINYYCHFLDTLYQETQPLPYHHLIIGFWMGMFCAWILL